MRKKVLVCIPVNRSGLVSALTIGMDGPVLAYSVTPELCEMFDLDPQAEEDAEYAALLIASVDALRAWGERLVICAQATIDHEREVSVECKANGGVWAVSVTKADITAWFSDEDPQLGASAAAVAVGRGLEEAWALPEVVELLAECDLCWHAPQEKPSFDQDVNC